MWPVNIQQEESAVKISVELAMYCNISLISRIRFDAIRRTRSAVCSTIVSGKI